MKKIIYIDPENKKEKQIFLEDDEFSKFFEWFEPANATDLIPLDGKMLPKKNIKMIKRENRTIKSLNDGFEKTRFDKCVERGFSAEEKIEWKKCFSGFFFTYPESRSIPLSTLKLLAISVFNQNQSSNLKKMIMRNGDVNFDYRGFINEINSQKK